MIKKIVFLIITTLFMVTGVYADDSRWVWVDSDSTRSVYIDKQTIDWDESANAITFWSKTTTLSGEEWLSQRKVSLDYKMIGSLAFESNSPDAGRERKTFSPVKYYPIWIDSTTEKEVNAVCDELHLASIWGTKTHNWKWIKSTSKDNYFICTDAFCYYGQDVYGVFAKRTWEGSRGHMIGKELYFINFNTRRIKRYDSPAAAYVIVPDSVEEAIFNEAKKIVNGNENS